MKLQEALQILNDLNVSESRKGIAERRITLLEIRALDKVLASCLTPEEMTLVGAALDSHGYWQVAERGDRLPVNNGYVLVEPDESYAEFCHRAGWAGTEDTEEAFEEYQQVQRLDERLAALQAEGSSADQPPAAE